MNISRIVLSLCCFASLAGAASSGPLRIESDERRGELKIVNDNKPVLVYAFASNQFKPYIRELYAANGANVLLDGPSDHLHHHGLMYAVRVNGVNFWEEVGDPGHEVSMQLLGTATGSSADGNWAEFKQRIHWVSHTNAALAANAAMPLLKEVRSIRAVIRGDEVAIEWQGAFEVGSAAVEIHGSAYNGLGMRFPRSFDRVAGRMNSENAPYAAAATWDVTPARWHAVTGRVENREATAVLFASPSNAGAARFFSMLNPFTYCSVTQNLDKQPLRYSAGERFQVRYLVAIYPGSKTAESLNKRSDEWLNTRPKS